ncbi:hypothetical protein D3C79_937550 [compost metagenome]
MLFTLGMQSAAGIEGVSYDHQVVARPHGRGIDGRSRRRSTLRERRRVRLRSAIGGRDPAG